MQLKSSDGSNVISSIDFELEIKLKDPCADSVLSLQTPAVNSILTSAQSAFSFQILTDTSLVETLNIASVVSSVTTVSCPTIEIDSITNSDGTAFDSAVFTLNKLA